MYTNQVLAQKKAQAQMDMPYRGFNYSKDLTTIGFGRPVEDCWKSIEKNKPDLMILTELPADNVKNDPQYRSVREKVPFMCTPSSESKDMFVKEWPYVQPILNNQTNGTYHSKIFGNKSNLVQVIILDHLKSEKKWSWLEAELKKDSALKIVSSSAEERDRVYQLIKKTKIKNLILLPSDSPIASIEKMDDFKSVFEGTTGDRLPASQSVETFGLIKINWKQRQAQIEIHSAENHNHQVVNFKF